MDGQPIDSVNDTDRFFHVLEEFNRQEEEKQKAGLFREIADYAKRIKSNLWEMQVNLMNWSEDIDEDDVLYFLKISHRTHRTRSATEKRLSRTESGKVSCQVQS